MAVLIFLGCLLGGIAIGLPIAWALLLCGAALMFWLEMFDVQIMAQTLVNGADSFSLLAIPFFVLAGEIMNAGGLSKRIVDLPMKLVGHKPGGLGYVGVLAAMIMASLSGSAVADTAAVAALLVPMKRQLPGQPGGGADCLWRHYRANYSPFHSVYYFRRFQRIIHQ